LSVKPDLIPQFLNVADFEVDDPITINFSFLKNIAEYRLFANAKISDFSMGATQSSEVGRWRP
jgi:hypothetical protein